MNIYFARLRYLVVLLVVLILAVSVYAFAAANTVPASGAGDGDEAISGYTITNVTYDTNTDSDPSDIDLVSFDLAPQAGAGAATEVFVKLVSSSNTWYPCTLATSPNWDCPITGAVTTLSADELRVVAAQ